MRGRYAQCNCNHLQMKFLLFIFTAIFFLNGCDFKSSKQYFDDAEKLEEQGMYKEAIQLLDKALKKDDKFLGAYINRGADKSALGDFQGAIADYEKTLSIDSENTLALFNIGNNYKRLRDNRKAIVYYGKAFRTKGGEGINFDYTPNNYFGLGKFDVPAREIYFERAIAFYNIDSLKNAYHDFKYCINSNFMKGDSYYYLGYIYLATSQKEIACKCFYQAKSFGDTASLTAIKKYCND